MEQPIYLKAKHCALPKNYLCILNYFKIQISGTAAKLGRPNAYHHCTLLVNVNKTALYLALEEKKVIFFEFISYFIYNSVCILAIR